MFAKTNRLLRALLFHGGLLLITANSFAGVTAPWQTAADAGDYDEAVGRALSGDKNTNLAKLITAARTLKLSDSSQWRAFIHYKPRQGGHWLSQVDAPYFFMSDAGKSNPSTELDATLAAFFSTAAKAPLRLTAFCRFVARRHWLTEQLGELSSLLPQNDCPEFDRFVDYLDAHVLTLIFPTAHPNSPSSAFGHTLLRIDKKDQRPESRLLNMSINFAAEVPEEVSGTAYAINGLSGGFPGKFRLLPYHMKLREYGQIENRDTWEYELKLDKASVDIVLRHAYEMLISHFDYYFLTENCSYHLLSLIEVAFPDEPLTSGFNHWTIPVDTIRLLADRGLSQPARFVPSSIRTLRARRENLLAEDSQLALSAFQNGLASVDANLSALAQERQAGILDLLSDYERYSRLKTDPGAQSSNKKERAILSRRSKLAQQSIAPAVAAAIEPPDQGHRTSRLLIQHQRIDNDAGITDFQLRPAYHDFRDPSAAYDDKAAIEMGAVGIAYDHTVDKVFLRRVTLVSIESIEPRGEFFKPVSWHTKLHWQRPTVESRHEFTFNVGAGAAFKLSDTGPTMFVFGESDLLDAPAFKKRVQLRLGVSVGAHWEPVKGIRSGLEADYRKQIGGEFDQATAELWLGFAITPQLSFNLDASVVKTEGSERVNRVSGGVRVYF